MIQHLINLFFPDIILCKFGYHGFYLTDIAKFLNIPFQYRQFVLIIPCNLSEDQVFSLIIQNLHLLCTGLFKYPVSKSCKTQYIDIHDTVSRMHTDQILLRLHCELFRYEHYEILQWVFF